MDEYLRSVLESLCKDYNNRNFQPILESDVVAYMYHLWISQFGGVNRLHLDTRICHKLDNRFDFVLGNVDYNADKPCVIKPELVVEVKFFPYGFTDQQHRVHYFHVIDDDLPKLKTLKNSLDSRYEFLFDEVNYLKGSDKIVHSLRIERLIKRRDDLDSRIIIILCEKIMKELRYKII